MKVRIETKTFKFEIDFKINGRRLVYTRRESPYYFSEDNRYFKAPLVLKIKLPYLTTVDPLFDVVTDTF